jgi:hypothetical protein
MPFTSYFDHAAITANLFSASVYSVPGTWYIALSTTTPTQAQGTSPPWNFTEPSGNGYTRVAVTNNSTNFTSATAPATGWTIQNATAISFPFATGSWGTLTYVGIFDAASTGHLVGYGALASSQAITTNQLPSFAANALTITNN